MQNMSTLEPVPLRYAWPDTEQVLCMRNVGHPFLTTVRAKPSPYISAPWLIIDRCGKKLRRVEPCNLFTGPPDVIERILRDGLTPDEKAMVRRHRRCARK